MTSVLVTLVIMFAELSLLGFGGGNALVPEMQRQVVDVQHWMSAQDFSTLYALARAAPGPNMMIVPLVGWRVAGLAGLIVATVSNFLPTSILVVCVVGLWRRYESHPWRRIAQDALAPMATGMVAAAACLLVETSATTTRLTILVVAVTVLGFRTKLHPLWLLAAGTVFGLLE